MPSIDSEPHRLFVSDVGKALIVLFALGVIVLSVVLLNVKPCDAQSNTKSSSWSLTLRDCAEQHQARFTVSRDGQSLLPVSYCDDLIFTSACT